VVVSLVIMRCVLLDSALLVALSEPSFSLRHLSRGRRRGSKHGP